MIHILHLLWIVLLSVALGVAIGVAEALNDLQPIIEEAGIYE